jgi:hypothetical protein
MLPLMTLLVACDPSVTPAGDALSPPPNFPFAVSDIVPGADVTFSAESDPFATVFIGLSVSGTGVGPCAPTGCADLGNNVINLGAMFADANGDASAFATAPLSARPGSSLWFQAVDLGGGVFDKSPVVQKTVRACFDDGFGDNASLADAADLFGVGLFTDLTVCGDNQRGGDVDSGGDYYETFFFGGQTLNFRIDFAHSEGDLDLELIDELGNVVARSETTADFEEASFTLTGTQRIYAHVYRYGAGSDPVSSTYDLDFSTSFP